MKQKTGEIIHNAILRFRQQNLVHPFEFLNKTQWLTVEELEDFSIKKFQTIVRYAAKNVEYYSKLFRTNLIDPKNILNIEDIKKIPKLTKTIIASNPINSFISKQKLPYSIKQTAGTSGIPVKILVDRNAESYFFAARYRSQSWHGIKIGDRQLRFWGRPISHKSYLKEKAKDILLNRVRITNITENKNEFNNIINSINRFNPDYIYGYSSLIYEFAEKLMSFQNNCILNLKGIIATAEVISQAQKQVIKKVLKSKVIGEYGCSELDIIAFECEYGKMHIMAENVFLEIQKNENEKSNFGKVIVTDLNNKKMPMIRYELDDLVLLSDKKCECGRGLPIISKILGRHKDQYIVLENGEKFHSVIFAYVIEDLIEKGYDIFQFQVIQDDFDTIKVSIIPRGKTMLDPKTIEDVFYKETEPILGGKMNIVVNLVNEIEHNRYTGKYSYFKTLIE